MERIQLLEEVKRLYSLHGAAILTFSGLKKAGIYYHLYNRGITLKSIVSELGFSKEYEDRKLSEATWNWPRLVEEARAVVKEHGHFPPAGWFQTNGRSAVVAAVYSLGKTWNDLRIEVGCSIAENFVESRNGMRWESHAEASLSNFLFARGIEHRTGDRYPEEISEENAHKYAFFDNHFLSSDGRWIDVEIWGDRPNGHNENEYAIKRAAKERFNSTNPRFLGIHFQDCYSEEKLTQILEPYIGVIEPSVFTKPEDRMLHSTHWSNADELLIFCRAIADQQPDKEFPTEGWLRKRGRFANRPGPAYNTASIYIKTWLGGVRKLREIIGQSHASTAIWTKESAVESYLAWYKQFGFTAQQARSGNRKKDLSAEERKKSQNVMAAVRKFYGSVDELNAELGIEVERLRRWSKELISSETMRLYQRYNLRPGQIKSADTETRVSLGINEEDAQLAGELVAAGPGFFGSMKNLYDTLNLPVKVDIRTVLKKLPMG